MSEQSIAERAGYYQSMMQPIPGDFPCGKIWNMTRHLLCYRQIAT